MKDQDGFVNARRAAEFAGYDPSVDERRAVRAFNAWIRKKGIRTYHRNGTQVFKRRDLERAIEEESEAYEAERLSRRERIRLAGQLAARGEDARHLLP